MSDYPETELIVKETNWKSGVKAREGKPDWPWKKFELIDTSGMKYSAFEQDIQKDPNAMKVVNAIGPGYALKIAYEQNGQYRNLKRIIEYEPPVADSSKAKEPAKEADKMSKEDWAAKDRRIARESCLSSAASALRGSAGLIARDVVEMAKVFEKYVYGEEDETPDD